MEPTKKKRAPEEAWDALEKMELDDEVDRVLGLSDKELDDELAKGGADPQQVRNRGRQIAAQIVPSATPTLGQPPKPSGAAAPAKVIPLRRVRLVALLAAALGVFAVVLLVRRPDGDVTQGNPARRRELAAEHRAKASAECAASHWQACLDALDDAKDLDPAGDQDVSVRDLRRSAESALHAGDAGR
jgi:hypothetical protein